MSMSLFCLLFSVEDYLYTKSLTWVGVYSCYDYLQCTIVFKFLQCYFIFRVQAGFPEDFLNVCSSFCWRSFMYASKKVSFNTLSAEDCCCSKLTNLVIEGGGCSLIFLAQSQLPAGYLSSLVSLWDLLIDPIPSSAVGCLYCSETRVCSCPSSRYGEIFLFLSPR